jgi:plastocyanin
VGSRRLPVLAALSAALTLATQAPAVASAATTAPSKLFIGVDHVDVDHPNPDAAHAVFEYTDFFSREVTVHKGDTLVFDTRPGAFHIVALSLNEQQARAAYPLALLDTDDSVATGSQHDKIQLGPSNGPIQGGSLHGGGTIGGPNDAPKCGLSGEPVCHFAGGDDVESEGGVAGFGATGPTTVHWSVEIDANAGQRYNYFCYIHPGMLGHFTVVPDSVPTTTQAQVNAASALQFASDRSSALATEAAANVVHFTGGAPGTRTYNVNVGMSAADRHVAIDEMLPQHLNIAQGDKVNYQWADPHNVHTVGFPADETKLPPPFFPDGTAGEEANELVGDPGNARPGTLLSHVSTVVDAGFFVGTGYGVQPTVQRWSVATNDNTDVATFTYMCTVHDFMLGSLTVGEEPDAPNAPEAART